MNALRLWLQTAALCLLAALALGRVLSPPARAGGQPECVLVYSGKLALNKAAAEAQEKLSGFLAAHPDGRITVTPFGLMVGGGGSMGAIVCAD